MTNKFSLLLTFLLLTLAFACEGDDDPVIENPEELITGVTLTLASASNGTVVYTFSDPDGEGGNDGTTSVSGGPLMANTVYNATVSFAAPDEIVDTEIREEDEDHQVFYVVSGGLDLSFSYEDADGDGNPLGLITTVQTGAASTGDIRVVLRHEPMKGPSLGIADFVAAGGESDADVTFQATIQ